MKSTLFTFLNQSFHLHPLKALFWEEKSTLLLSDLHLGKVAHFRKEGIPVPATAGDENWDKLLYLIINFKPRRVLFLGDLFHSTYNIAWESLGDLIKQFNTIRFELVVGNHDILSRDQYERFGLGLHDFLKEPPFLFSHEPCEDKVLYNIAGHIHPCVWLSGSGKQRLKLACFFFGKKQGILPAFGSFTGMATIGVEEGDQVFVVAEDTVLRV
jgi:DNA ligase-associated metallophosphoesterase